MPFTAIIIVVIIIITIIVTTTTTTFHDYHNYCYHHHFQGKGTKQIAEQVRGCRSATSIADILMYSLNPCFSRLSGDKATMSKGKPQQWQATDDVESSADKKEGRVTIQISPLFLCPASPLAENVIRQITRPGLQSPKSLVLPPDLCALSPPLSFQTRSRALWDSPPPVPGLVIPSNHSFPLCNMQAFLCPASLSSASVVPIT